MHPTRWLDAFVQDLSYGGRELRRNPASLISQLVAMEQRSIGIRMAVGAGSRDIVRFVLGRARLIVVGLAVGIAATLFLLRRFGLTLGVTDPFQPGALVGAAFLLAVAGFIACLIPALRNGRTDPMSALRRE